MLGGREREGGGASNGSEEWVSEEFGRGGSVFRFHLQAADGEVFESWVRELWQGRRSCGLTNLEQKPVNLV